MDQPPMKFMSRKPVQRPTTAVSRRNEPLRATEQVRATTDLQKLAGNTLNVNQGHNLSGGPPGSPSNLNEQRLSTAYTLYLQQTVLNQTIIKIANFYRREQTEKIVQHSVEDEVAVGFALIREELLIRRVQMATMQHLFQTNTFLQMYSEFRAVFEGKQIVFAELQRALESRFNSIALKGMVFEQRPTDPKEVAPVDLDALLVRIKQSLKPLKEKVKSPTDAKSFLNLFQTTVEGVVESAAKAERLIAETIIAQEEIEDMNSKLISSQLLAKKEDS